MRAQGWHRDPYGVHGERWFSDGKPTRLVRDEGVESYDAPPQEPPRPRTPAVGQLVTDGGPGRTPTTWPSWTLWLPFWLTLPVAGLFILFVIIGASLNSGNCFDVCGGSPGYPGWAPPAAFGEAALAVIIMILLGTGLHRFSHRRTLVLVSWVVCALASVPLAGAVVTG